jgi:RimJ/RimL family protein N-acetyltransferase
VIVFARRQACQSESCRKRRLAIVGGLEQQPRIPRRLCLASTTVQNRMGKRYDALPPDTKWFFIEKKDGTKIGTLFHWFIGDLLEIGYVLAPSEREKGYCTEAVNIVVDYLFLSKDIPRVQAHTDAKNMSSQNVLKKVGFKKEGTIRKSGFSRGEWRDLCLYSILREEWKEPRVLICNLDKR